MERKVIGVFGVRNAGKSSLINAITGQAVSIVSETAGTTTDPVRKSMEIPGLGAVVLIDTPGADDIGNLGKMRAERAFRVLDEVDAAILVTASSEKLLDIESLLVSEFNKRNIKYIIVCNKSDLHGNAKIGLSVSALSGDGVDELIKRLPELTETKEKHIVKDFVNPGDTVVLVIPIDESAPKDRIILPQQQVLRELLDAHCTSVCCRDTDLKSTLERLGKNPDLVITDSQVFKRVDEVLDKNVPLTSFSILFANYKGDTDFFKSGISALKRIKNGDRILICEGCTHHRQCNDIGTVKIPNMIRKYTDASPEFEFTSGRDFPADLGGISLIVHCGACMLGSADMKSRIKKAKNAGVPMINYGMLIAEVNGILDRCLV